MIKRQSYRMIASQTHSHDKIYSVSNNDQGNLPCWLVQDQREMVLSGSLVNHCEVYTYRKCTFESKLWDGSDAFGLLNT